jgi:hypothetical protein
MSMSKTPTQKKKQDRPCPPCPDCGTELYEKFWGNGGWMPTEKATDKNHGPSDCVPKLRLRVIELEAQLLDDSAQLQAGIALVAKLMTELREARDWEDVKDEWSEAIHAAHPTRSESHDEYGIAMQMVGHRHSKGELVALVNWLLVRLRQAR